jgi:ankyrin repeat protein
MILEQEKGQIVCIIGDLDECDSTNHQLLKDIIKLRETAECWFKVVVTTGKDSETCSLLQPFFVIDLDTEPGVARDRKYVMRNRIRELTKDSIQSGHLEHDAAQLLRIFDPPFIAVDLMLSRLELPSHSPATIRVQQELSKVATSDFSLSSIYEQLLRDIPPSEHEWSREALGWLVYSAQPLTLDQLAVALVLNDETTSLSMVEKRICEDMAGTLTRCLTRLVTIEGEEVRLAHPSIRDFLVQRQSSDGFGFENQHRWHLNHAMTCLRYLCLEDFAGRTSFMEYHGGQAQLQLPELPSRCYQFLLYAVHHWPMHCRKAARGGSDAENLISTTVHFLSDNRKVRWWSESFMFLDDHSHAPGQLLVEPEPHTKDDSSQKTVDAGPITWHYRSWYNPLYLASRLGLAAVVSSLCRSGDYSGTDKIEALMVSAEKGHCAVVKVFFDLESTEVLAHGYKALEKACEQGHEAVVQQILDRQLENETEPNLSVCLCLAAENGHTSIVRMLLQSQVPHDGTTDKEHVKASMDESLQLAASNGYDAVITELLKFGADPEVAKEGWVPLHLAAKNGHLASVQTLLAAEGCDVNTGTWSTKPLHQAACEGHVSVVKELLKHNADIEAIDTDGCTPLHLAAQKNFPEVVQVMLDGGANIEALDRSATSYSKWTPLHYAACHGGLESANVLLSNGADPDPIEVDRWRPLHLAAQNGHLEVVRRLLESGASEDSKTVDGYTPLLIASKNSHLGVLETLVDYGANLSRITEDGLSVVHLAAGGGNIQLVRRLLELGADVDLISKYQWTPLHMAARSGHLDILELLIENGADFSRTTDAGFSTLHIAADNGRIQTVRRLLELGADVDLISKYQWTPLHMAARSGHLDILELLIENGADFSRTTDAGFSTLHIAADNGRIQTIRRLLELGADVDLSSKYQWTPLHVAASNGHLDILELLIENGADLSRTTDEGLSILHIAAQNGKIQIVRRLLELAASVDSVDDDRWTPLQIAASNGHPEVVALLIDHGADIKRRAADGRSAVHFARSNSDVMEKLLQAGADISTLDDAGRTVLFYSRAAPSEGMTKWLLGKGAEENHRDRFGRTARDCAIGACVVREPLSDEPLPRCRYITEEIGGNIARTVHCDLCREDILEGFFYRKSHPSSLPSLHAHMESSFMIVTAAKTNDNNRLLRLQRR